jgi:dienelactone hydrolase
VLLHGCGGLTATYHGWAETLRSWGYVALLVDSFGPRGETVVCDTWRVDPLHARMPDAYAARSYLAAQPFVAPARIGLIGWSHGGITTLHAVDDVYLSRLGRDRFRAAIAFYPGCLIRLVRLNAPLLILIGEEDDWTPAARCRRMEVETAPSHEFTLTIYPGAYHDFDRRDRDADVYLGHRLERHPEAAADAEQRVRRFLTRHLGP